MQDPKDFIKKRYGEIAKDGTSCCPSCGCGVEPKDVALQVGYTDNEVNNLPEGVIMGLGCGNPVALSRIKEGETVLDLGSGSGVDVFLAAKKVGPSGRVIGVDITEEMVNKAKALASKYGYNNVEFQLGEIEELPIGNESVDVVISNCVINLSPDKERVFREAYRVLKPGGRIMISDLVTQGNIPEEFRKSFEAWVNCVGGAIDKKEYLEIIRKAGFKNVKIVSEKPYNIGISKELAGKILSIMVEAYK
ncbi:MAG: arsenite methyltransferase [Candidatus Methanomethyliales bacterium]|nr:arsenite methyltransferase [Candidatus Methanomethylicales archaeon]